MDAKYRPYIAEDSSRRISDILEGGAAFEDSDTIPGRAALTYENGFYVECTAIFIDIRGSSQLREKFAQRRTLGKVYRAYVSECVAVLNSSPRCRQVFIQGDCVSAVFETPDRLAVQEVFPLVASLNSVIELLNFHLVRLGHSAIKVGIGIDSGRALMLQAGFYGSGINDIIWMGDVLNQASHLCHAANKDGRMVIQVSSNVKGQLDQRRLSVDGADFISPVWALLLQPEEWQCDVVNVGMHQHLQELKRKHQPPPTLLGGFLSGLAAPPTTPAPIDTARIMADLLRRK